MNRSDLIRTWLSRTLGAALVLFVLASVHRAYSTVPVTVDGTRVSARLGTPVTEIVHDYSLARPGDLLSAKDRHVVRAGAGEAVVVLVNGAVAESGVVRPGDRVIAFSGADIVEPVVVETRTVQVEPRIIGTGTIDIVVSEGLPGTQRVTVGAVSRDVITSETVAPAEPAVVRRVPADGAKVVALTFDDGPWPGQTDSILRILDEKDVPATFFMLGLRVKASPALARAVSDAGHVVGNHTHSHTHLTMVDATAARREIVGTNALIARTTGVTPHWFRAPAGKADGKVYAELKREGMRAALWTVDPQDWRADTTAASIVATVKAGVRPGAVVLLHDGGGDQRETIKALPTIIDALRAQGYQFVTLDEMESVKASW